MSNKTYDFSEIEAVLNAELDEADALVLKRWREHLKKHPVKGKAPALDLAAIRAGLRQHHGGPGPHKSGSSQDVHGDPGAGASPPVPSRSGSSRDGSGSLIKSGELPDWTKYKVGSGHLKVEKNSPYADDVVKAMGAVPEAHIDGLSQVAFLDQEFLDDDNTVAKYHPGLRSVLIATKNKGDFDTHAQGVFGALIHEIGHHVHLARMNSADADAWAKLSNGGKNARISSYAQTNQGEHFAEAYQAYNSGTLQRWRLKNLEPESYKFMRGLKKKLLPIGEFSSVDFEIRYRG